MNEFKSFVKSRKIELILSAIYVGIGTLAVCSIYPKDLFYGNWSLVVLLITFPVTIISFGYRYAEADSLLPVFVIQFVMFIITYLILISSLFKSVFKIKK
ncbi:hypothetical protein [Epilithonimonas lactis]|uniref:Uncharacterized protein n=1 Tax=Epilithonimonas lactis TaxID=421072 RepID=A0A085BJF2_9FLAO|nr:hypothetical protein [Epilithonimonas lactis]KFC22597.1 hypothetical protein IO89_05955 [Epilithonimonas lactis]SEQ81547.1 hypothetical protein SAMN04488097_3106 [Epilithonimonas lactis]